MFPEQIYTESLPFQEACQYKLKQGEAELLQDNKN